MTDIISAQELSDAGLSEQHTVALIELLFFAYRDFVSDPDEILGQFGFGRAHHRVVHFVGRDPGMTCLLYTSDAADDLLCVDLGGRRLIKKKKNNNY